jgi:hypothetical protein
MTDYIKTCKKKGCGKEFISHSRNERYCSACKIPVKVLRRLNRRRRLEYEADKVRFRLESRSRKEARELQIRETLVVCPFCNELFPIALLELHHKDGNPMNNTKENRSWACESCHKSISKAANDLKKASDVPDGVGN